MREYEKICGKYEETCGKYEAVCGKYEGIPLTIIDSGASQQDMKHNLHFLTLPLNTFPLF